MSKMNKYDRLKKQIGENVTSSLGAYTPPDDELPTGPDKYMGWSKGNGGNMLVSDIIADPDQARKKFEQASLDLMAKSLKELGQLQPIRVRWSAAVSKWIVVDGERRWRAAKIAGLDELACVFVEDEMTKVACRKEQLVANCMREDLADIERAQAFKELMDAEGWSAAKLADQLHLHRATVGRALQVLELPESVKADVSAGKISAASAQELSKLADPDEQIEVAEQIKTKKLNRTGAAAAVKDKKATKTKGPTAMKKLPKKKTLRVPSGNTVMGISKHGLTDDAFLADLRAAVQMLERTRVAA